MSLRAAWRGLMLIFSLCCCFAGFVPLRLRAALRGREVSARELAEWSNRCGQTLLAAMGIRYRIEGDPPVAPAVIVANHLSYLDIVIGGAAFPCAFVAKQEVAQWPIFGTLARLGRTIFLDRASRASAWEAADRMVERLGEGASILFFPEGTSTDGSEVIRFHSTLFASAIESGCVVVPAAIFYEPQGSVTERDLCWFGDESFMPHLLKVLSLGAFTAVIRFGLPERYPDRRTAAWRSHDAVETLRGRGSGRRGSTTSR